MTEQSTNKKPYIEWDHPNGPQLVCKDGTLHTISRCEFLFLHMGIETLESLDEQFNSEPQKGW